MKVVAITDLSWRGTAAILVDRVGVVGRIQSVDDATGDMEADGARVVLHGVPVEGGLNVYLSGRPLGHESVRVDPDASSVVIAPREAILAGFRPPYLPALRAGRDFPPAFGWGTREDGRGLPLAPGSGPWKSLNDG